MYRSPRSVPHPGRSPVARAAAAACCLLACVCTAYAQAPTGAHGYADESRDWGVAPGNSLRPPPYHAPTPRSIPGAQVLSTQELRALLAGAAKPVLIDVLSERGHRTLAGAAWIPGAGEGTNFIDPAQLALKQALASLSGGDRNRALVFLCANAQCWLSYNAALRAVAAGYTRVYWYRGGIEAWMAAGLPTARTPGER